MVNWFNNKTLTTQDMTDLNKEEKDTPAEVDPPVEKPEPTIVGLQAQVVELEGELSKQVGEKENYKQGVLSKEEELKKVKAQLKALLDSPPKEDPQEPEVEKPKEEPKKDEQPKVETVESAGYNPETEARAQFARLHPDVDMSKVLENYRGGTYETVTEYMEALEDAKNFSDFKSGNKSSAGTAANQGGGVSEVENKSHPNVTAYDIAQANKYFKGDLDRYLKHKQK